MDYYDARADLHTLGMCIAGFETTTDWAAIRRDQRPLLAVRLSESNSEQEQAETLLNALVCGIIDGITRKWDVPYPETPEDRNELIPWAMRRLAEAVKELPVPISQGAAIGDLMNDRRQQGE